MSGSTRSSQIRAASFEMSGGVEARPGVNARHGILEARPQDTVRNLAIAVAFIVLMAVQIARHQMWRDETNAWGIVLASPSLPALFHNLHYEGHPGLWHLLLWCASWITPEPAAMKAVQASVAAGFILLIALRSPFRPLEKVLLLLNYYVVFEYSVVSRNYGIGFLLALTYAHLRVTRPDRLLLNAVVLGLLANTNIYATILSGALAFELMLGRLVTSRGAILRTARELAPAAAIFMGFLLLCAATIMPAHDISWRTTSRPFQHALDAEQLLHVVMNYLEIGIVPATAWLLRLPSVTAGVVGLLLLPVLWGGIIWLFRRDGRALLVLGLTAAGAVVFGQLIYPGWMRHWGITFVAFVVALWMQRSWRPQPSWLAVALLWFGALAGGAALTREAARPFSYAGAAAQWLRDHDLRDAALIGTPDTSAAGVAELLRRPMYFLDCSCVDSFLRFQNRRDSYLVEQLPDRLMAAMDWAAARPAVLVNSYPVSEDQREALSARRIQVEQLAAFIGAIAPEEDFYLYKVTSPAR